MMRYHIFIGGTYHRTVHCLPLARRICGEQEEIMESREAAYREEVTLVAVGN